MSVPLRLPAYFGTRSLSLGVWILPSARPPKSSATRPERQGWDARPQSWSWARQDEVAIGRWWKETVTTPEEAAHAEAKVLLEAGPEFCGGTVDWKDMETLTSRMRSGFRKSKELSRHSERRGGAGTTGYGV